MKKFNTSGPCNSIEHYMIDAATRLQGVEELIDDKQYFVIHAARQSGKTTYLKDLAARLNAGEKYYALWCSLENTQNVIDPKEGIPSIVKKIENQLRISNIPHKTEFERLDEDRVRRVIEPMILGKMFVDRESDDFLYIVYPPS
jgi:hypothetical protein